MANPATVNIQALLAVTTPGGEFYPNFQATGTITPVCFSSVLASGLNTFAIPASSVCVYVSPPAVGGITLLSKTISADTGTYRPQGLPWIEFFDTSNLPADYYIYAGSLTTGYTTLWFF